LFRNFIVGYFVLFREFDRAESPQLVGYMTMLTRRWEQVSNRADDADAVNFGQKKAPPKRG
jgi:hypothetical protein